MLDLNNRIRLQWQLIALNAFAAVLNATVGIWAFTDHRWISMVAAVLAAGFSTWITWGLYRKLPQVTAEEHQRVIDILKNNR